MHFENYRVLFKSVRLAFCQFHVFPVAMPISTVFPALQQKDKEVKEAYYGITQPKLLYFPLPLLRTKERVKFLWKRIKRCTDKIPL